MIDEMTTWDQILIDRYDQIHSALGIDGFDDPNDLINLIKQTLNSDTESTEFMLQDAFDKIVNKLNKSDPNGRTSTVMEIYKKLADANNKKKTHSEVFTKPQGAQIAIRGAYRQNPQPFLSLDSKMCEVSFGTGNFIQEMVNFLVISLKSEAAMMYGTGHRARAMTDDELRIWILDHMIYGVELQEHFIPLALFILDPDNKCKNLPKHLYQGDSLLFDFVFDGVNMKGQFNVVFGNPPYNVLIGPEDRAKYTYSNESWVSNRESGALHVYFICLAKELLKDGGIMLYITRAGVLVNETLADFRNEVLKPYFNILLVHLPQKGTLFEGAQTTGLILVGKKKSIHDERTPTSFIRYIEGQEYSCSYTIQETDEKIPLLWHENTISLWESYSVLSNRFITFKGMSRKDSNPSTNGHYDIVDSIVIEGPIFMKTNKGKIRKKNTAKGAERIDIKMLASSGCTDDTGSKLKWLENYYKDELGEYMYTDNVIAIVSPNGLEQIEDIFNNPSALVYGSLFRIDRNISAAFYRMFSYDMNDVEFSKEIDKWCKNII